MQCTCVCVKCLLLCVTATALFKSQRVMVGCTYGIENPLPLKKLVVVFSASHLDSENTYFKLKCNGQDYITCSY